MLLSFYVGSIPFNKVSADDTNTTNTKNFTLSWDNKKDYITIDTKGVSSDVSVGAKIYFNGSGTYKAGQVKITVPKEMEWGRNKEKAVISDNYKTGLTGAGLETSIVGDEVVFTNIKEVTAPTYNINISYSINPLYVSNTSDHELTVTATADATDDQEKIDETKTIKCKINTQVNKITADKQKVSSDVKGLVTSTGMLRNWSSDAEEYYGYSESAFNSDSENYNIVEYRSQITTEGNQPYYLSVKDTPDNNGVVIGAYASGVVTGKMTEQNGVYTAADYSKKYANNTNTQYVYVLVKYPKGDTKETRVTNSITAYATGIDDNKEVASSAAVADDTISSDAIYDGDIWGIKKNGIAENENTGKTILDNGGDKEISFWINPATAHTYKYGVKDNGSFKDNNNGPYKIDVTDDVMYLSSGENGITKRLSDGDYEFNKIVVYIKDSKIEDGFDSSGLPNMVSKPLDERPPVVIYAKTSVKCDWQKVGEYTTSVTPDKKGYYATSEIELPENTVQVKVSYGNSEKGSFGDTYIRAQIFGKLKHDGENVKEVLKDKDVNEYSLVNWANIQGFDKDGK